MTVQLLYCNYYKQTQKPIGSVSFQTWAFSIMAMNELTRQILFVKNIFDTIVVIDYCHQKAFQLRRKQIGNGSPLELVSKELNHFGVIADLFRQIGGHSSRFVLFCSFWRLFTIKMIKSVKVFPFSFWKIITKYFFLLHKIQTPGINMQNGRQVI